MTILYIILAIAFIFRLASLKFGLPHADVYGDEIVHVVVAFKMLAAKSLIVPYGNSYLPPLLSYLLVPVFSLIGFFGVVLNYFAGFADYKELVILHKEWFLIPGRIISALFGTASVYFLYLLAEKIFNRKIAMVSAFLLAVDFLSVHESQIGHIWSPIAFFFILGIYCVYSLYLTGQKKWYVFSAIAIGFGYAIGQAPILVLFPFIFAHYLFSKKNDGRFWTKNLIISISIFGLIFLAFSSLNYYTLYKHFIEAAGSILKIFGVDFKSAGEISNVVGKTSISHSWRVGYGTLLYSQPFVLFAGIIGSLVFLKKKRWPETAMLIIFPVFYFLFVLLTTDITYRYVLPVVPFLVIFSGYFVWFVYERLPLKKHKAVVLAAMIVVLSAYSVVSSVSYSLKLLKPYTTSQAVNWVYENIPSGSRIVSDIYLNSDKKSINFLKKHNEFDWLDSRKKYLLEMDDKNYPRPNYFLIDTNLTDVYKLPPEEKKADYFLIFFYSKQTEEKKRSLLDAFENKKELVAKFYPQSEKNKSNDLLNFYPHWILPNLLASEFVGPYVEIYKTVK